MLEIISVYLGILILGVGEVLFAKIVLNKRIQVSKLKFIFIFLFVTLLYALMYICLGGIVKTSLMYFLHMLEFSILFKISYAKAIFLTFLYAVVLLVADLFDLFLVTNVVGMNKMICYNEFAGSIIFNLIVCVLFVVITYIFRKPLRKIINTEISDNVKVLCLSLATFLCVGMIFYSIIKTYEFSNDILLYLVAIIVLIAILFSLIKQIIENGRLMKEYDKLLEFMTTYEIEIENQRILRHETKNEFLAIKAKLCDKQKDQEIIDYIDEILKEKIVVNQEKYAKLGYLPPNGIKGLCYFKVHEAENLGITVSINISSKIKKANINKLNIKNQRDLGKLLGIFLDNAVEASNNSENKKLGIEIYGTKDEETIIVISNTFDNEINKNKLGKERFSTKGKDRGHGLLLVRHIISKNNTFEIKTDISNNIYVQKILIKND